MWIDKENHVHNQDNILDGFTFQDLIDAAIANGDNAQVTFDNLMYCVNLEARKLFDEYKDELEDIVCCS